jgi:riboflavin kinase/FMN adenylyltransferase
MQIFEGVKSSAMTSVMTIGNFDGIHRGHQKLLEILKNQSRLLKQPSVVMTFQPHPMKVLAPDRPIFRLFSLEDQAAQLAALGIDILVRQPFTMELAQTSAADFLQKYIVEPFHPVSLVIGHDFHFGKARSGNVAFLQAQAGFFGYQVQQVPAYEINHQVVSSTRIRELLSEPDLAAVHELLGRNYFVEGEVQRGDGRGEKLGFPTANIAAPEGLALPRGVYITAVYIKGQKYSAITNVGLNPTFEDPKRALRVESLIFDLNNELYDETIKVEFYKFLRIEKKFKDARELIEQIQIDVQQAKEFWHGSN